MDREKYAEVYERHAERREQIRQMGGEKAVATQKKAGKWTARERIEYFFDPGTFTEIGMFVSHRTTEFGMAAGRGRGRRFRHGQRPPGHGGGRRLHHDGRHVR